jgi:hypothetical protein
MPLIRPDLDPAERVFGQYGHVMLVVQTFEQHLGFLSLWHRVGEEQGLTRRNLEKTIVRFVHAMSRATASELRNSVADRLDDELLAEVSRLIEWRDVLAHRYLRERARPTGASLRFARGTVRELADLKADFAEAGEHLEELIDASMAEASLEGDALSADLARLITGVGSQVLSADPDDATIK